MHPFDGDVPTASPLGNPPLAVAADARFHIVLNGGSGRNDLDTTKAAIGQVMRDAGRHFQLTIVAAAGALAGVAADVVAQAQADGGVVVAAGGDGTINTVAQAALGSGRPFGALPRGTFNYFGRTHGLSQDIVEATRTLVTSRAHPVQVGLLNDRVFLVNASLGLYPQMLEDREAFKRQYGRSRLVAFWAALVSILKAHHQLRLQVTEHAGLEGTTGGVSQRQRALRTPTLFVGNNRLQLEQVGIAQAGAVGLGQLVAVAARPVSPAGMLWLALRGAVGQLGAAEKVDSFAFERITVATGRRRGRDRPIKVATDGEVAWLRPPLEFSVSPQCLYLLKPETRPEARQEES